jgi:hypothetical protein
MISSFGLKLGNIWRKECVSLNYFYYIHHVDPKIEIMANKDLWEEVKYLIRMQVENNILNIKEVMET